MLLETRATAERLLIVKGAPEDVLKHSTRLQSAAGDVAPLSEATRARTSDVFSKLGEEGYRALGIAFRRVGAEQQTAAVGDEDDLVFAGLRCAREAPGRNPASRSA